MEIKNRMVNGPLLSINDLKELEDGSIIEVVWADYSRAYRLDISDLNELKHRSTFGVLPWNPGSEPRRYWKVSDPYGDPWAEDAAGHLHSLDVVGDYPLTMVKIVKLRQKPFSKQIRDFVWVCLQVGFALFLGLGGIWFLMEVFQNC